MRQLLLIILFLSSFCQTKAQFVKQNNGKFTIDGKPYYYIGTNYWYGIYLPLVADKTRGIDRLKYELDFLQDKGVTNLRILAGAEGSGKILGNYRVGPPLQPSKGVFDTSVLYGLDVLLNEMSKRNMKAVIYFSNNWEWSGGFLQYLNWNGVISDSVLQNKMEWETMKDVISQFYKCEPCKADYLKQVDVVLSRINSVNGKRYISDPTIMSWELANEPRPMKPTANKAYSNWILTTAAYIKSKDKNHLVCLGHEGEIGTQDYDLYKQIHEDSNVDYLTIHIWPKNWGWITSMSDNMDDMFQTTVEYVNQHQKLAKELNKPLVIEEFGMPRDELRFDTASLLKKRNLYYDLVFSMLKNRSFLNVAGINFWAFNGKARPVKDQLFWKPGDDYMGDPPMEQQSLYGVFDSDTSTWKLIETYSKLLRR